MARQVFCPQVIVGASGDANNTFDFVNLGVSGPGRYYQDSNWVNGTVQDGVVLTSMRNNTQAFVGVNYYGSPTNIGFEIKSTDPSDTTGINFFILPGTPPAAHLAAPIVCNIPYFRRSPITNPLANATLGVDQLTGGTVTINTNAVSTAANIFCCNRAVNALDLTHLGNVYVSNVVAGTSFTITSTKGFAANSVVWFVLPLTQLSGPGIPVNNMVCQTPYPQNSTVNYGVAQLSGGTGSVIRSGLTSNSILYCNTHVVDPNPSNRGYLACNANYTNGTLDFASTNPNDTQTFYWCLFETADGVV